MKTNPAKPVGTPRRSTPAAGWQRLRNGILTSLTAVVAVMLVFASSSCEGPDTSTPIPAEAFNSRPSGSLAAGDVIRVSFPGAPELNTVQKIMANGKVSLPTIGDVTAQGKSVSTLQSQLTGLYQSHLQNPTVLVGVDQMAACVYVSGEVMKPGKVPGSSDDRVRSDHGSRRIFEVCQSEAGGRRSEQQRQERALCSQHERYPQRCL